MNEAITNFGVVGILVAAFIDVFFVSGVVFNGLLLFGVATTFFAADLASPVEIFVLAFFGTTAASMTNFAAGTLLRNTERMTKIRKTKAGIYITEVMTGRGLLPSIFVLRFFTLSRPIYGCLYGSSGVSLNRFFVAEVTVSLIWTAFWTFVLVGGYSSVEEFLRVMW